MIKGPRCDPCGIPDVTEIKHDLKASQKIS